MALAQDSILNLTLYPIYANHHMHTHRLFDKLLAPENEPRNPLVVVDLRDLNIKYN